LSDLALEINVTQYRFPISRVWLVGFALAWLGPLTPAQELSDEEKKEGFVSLFNGKDLTGWRFDEGESPPTKLPDNWKVEDGVIKVLGGGRPHLASAREYGDFELRFEWRGTKEKYNSGLFIRSGKKIGANQINLAKGNEGGFIGGKVSGAKPVPKLQNKSGEWNEWRVLVQGDKIAFHCNGELAWEATGLKPAKGYLGLQAEGAPMEFRNLRLREIKQ
jgi:hypothetical protein